LQDYPLYPDGSFTYGNIKDELPFPKNGARTRRVVEGGLSAALLAAVLLELRGSDLREALEQMIRCRALPRPAHSSRRASHSGRHRFMPAAAGCYPHLSRGMEMRYVLGAPPRIVSLLFNKQPVRAAWACVSMPRRITPRHAALSRAQIEDEATYRVVVTEYMVRACTCSPTRHAACAVMQERGGDGLTAFTKGKVVARMRPQASAKLVR
jgi:hypothetical protein